MLAGPMEREPRDAGDEGAHPGPARRLRRLRRGGGAAPPAPGRVWVCIAAVALVGAAAWVGVIRHGPLTSGHHLLPWAAVAAAMVGASLLTVTFLVRGDAVTIGLVEIPLVVGVVFLRPVDLLVATVVAQIIVGVVKRRPPSKALFNILSFSCAAVVAVLTYAWVIGDSAPVSLRGWAACAVAVVAADLVMNVAVHSVVAVSAWQWPRAQSLTALKASTTSVPVGVVLVVIAVNAVSANRFAGLLFVVLGVMALAAQRSSTEWRRRYSNLERLYRFADRTSGVSEIDDVVTSILTEAREVMGSGVVELVLPDADSCLWYQLSDDDQLICSIRSEPGGLERMVLAQGAGLVASHDDQRESVGAALAERELRDAMAAPITFGDDLRGVLLVGNRQGPVTFDAEDLRLFEVLASHSGVAIRGGRLLDRLRREVTAREHEALHDSLTGLANRNLFDRFLERSLAERRVGRLVAVMLMDLDGFKEINDTMGHHVGDCVLREVASRLRTASAGTAWWPGWAATSSASS